MAVVPVTITTTIASKAFSADTGISGTDFITSTAAQTISGTTSANLVAGEFVEVSIDNGLNWTTAFANVGTNTWSLAQTLTASDTLVVRVSDAGGTGPAASQPFVLDTVAPTVASVTASTADGAYKVGDTISVQVNFTEAVTVSGAPQLSLETGTVDEVLDYTSGSGTSALTFDYTVQAGDTTTDLDYLSTTALTVTGATIEDAAGNAAILTLASPGATNSLGDNSAIVVDTTAPAVTSVTASSADGTYKVGDTISVQVNFSEAVTVTGTPQLTLETGTTDEVVNYASGSGTSTLTFSYTVQAGDTTTDLDYLSTTALALNGGTIEDAAGNAAVLTLATPGAANSLGDNKAIVVDGIAPTTTIATKAFSADTGLSSTDFITATAAQTISGTTSANLASGELVEVSIDNGATWTTASTSVGASTWSVNKTLAGSDTLQVRVSDTAGNSSAATTQAFVLDATAPTTTIATKAFSADTGSSSTDFITATAAQTISGTTSANMVAGEFVEVSIDNGLTWATASTSVGSKAWSVSQTLTASATLKVRVGDIAGNTGVEASQAYVLDTTAPTTTIATKSFSADTGISATDFITSTAAQTISGTTSANLVAGERVEVSIDNGSTWTTATTTVGTTAWSVSETLTASNTLKVRVSDTAGNSSAAATQAFVLDTTTPNVVSVTSSTANGTYKAGDVVSLQVEFSDAVTVTGSPQLTLETGTNDSVADYTSGSGTSTLTFSYVVRAGDSTADLDYRSTTALASNGGTIGDVAGHAATLTLPAPGGANSLGSNKAIEINSTAAGLTVQALPGGLLTSGGDGADILLGTTGNDRFFGGLGNDGIFGGEGIDTAVYLGPRSSYAIATDGLAHPTRISAPPAGSSLAAAGGGLDSLGSIERLSFEDRDVAFDFSGSALFTAELLGAVLGASSLRNLGLVGSILNYFDHSQTLVQATELLVNAGVMAQLAGGVDNQSFVNYVLRTLTGSDPSAQTTEVLAGFLDRGELSQAQLLLKAAELPLNDQNINLVGLLVTGLDYQPV